MTTTENVIMAQWFNDRWYKVRKDGEDIYIPSVTTQLGAERKPSLERWRADVGNREADLRMWDASQRGKRIHFALQTYLAGGIVVYNPWQNPFYTDDQLKEMEQQVNGVFFVLKEQDEMNDLWKLQRFFDIAQPQILSSEQTVYDIDSYIAGTLDVALYLKAGDYPVSGNKPLRIPETGIYIADLKTGKFVDEHMWRQIAPYAFAFEKMGKGEVKGGLILHTGADTTKGIPGLSVKIAGRNDLAAHLDTFFHISALWKANNPSRGPEIFSFPTKIQRLAF